VRRRRPGEEGSASICRPDEGRLRFIQQHKPAFGSSAPAA
jgi:hypothetical protein